MATYKNGIPTYEFGGGDITAIKDIYLGGGTNHNIYANAAVTDATERTISVSVLNATADAWLAMITLTPGVANPTTDFGYGTRHYFTASVSSASQSLNTAPTATTLTAVNAQSFTAVGENLVIPAVTPAANGSGITLTGLNITQGAIGNVADSEAITVTPIRIAGAAGAALETGIYTWTGIDITTPAQAVNGAANVATGLKITGGTQSASGIQRGIDITMAVSTHNAIRIATGALTIEGLLYYTSTASYLIAGASDTSTVLLQARNAAGGVLTVAQITTAAVVANSTFDIVAGKLTGAFVCNSQNMGTAGTMTINGLTLGGAVTGGNNDLNNISEIGLMNQAAVAGTAIKYSFTSVNVANLYGIYEAHNLNLAGQTNYFGHFIDVYTTTGKSIVAGFYIERLKQISSTAPTTIYGFFLADWGTTDAAMSNAYGLYLGNPDKGTSSITNLYGIYIGDCSIGTTNSYALYAAGGKFMSVSTAFGIGNVAYVWPAADGGAGTQLQTNGALALSWAAAGSLREAKNILGEVSPPEALDRILGTKVYRFRYKPEAKGTTGDYKTEYVGVTAEEAPWAMHYEGKILNPVNCFGFSISAIQALNAEISLLKGRIKELENAHS